MKLKTTADPAKKLDCTIEFKVASVKDATGGLTIEGYANTKTKDRVNDIVEPQAFAKSLPLYMKNAQLLYQHNWDMPIGLVTEAKIDENGLYVKASISSAADCADIRTKISEGILKTFSIGYNEVDAEYSKDTNTNLVKEVELLEISVVTIPANTDSVFGVSGASKELQTATALKGLLEQLTGDTSVLPKLMEHINTIQKEAEMKIKTAAAAPAAADPNKPAAPAAPANPPAADPAEPDADDKVMKSLKEMHSKMDDLHKKVDAACADIAKLKPGEPAKESPAPAAPAAPAADPAAPAAPAAEGGAKAVTDMSDEECLAELETLEKKMDELS